MENLLKELQKEVSELRTELLYYQNYDPLTGIYNKDAFCMHVEEILEKHSEQSFQLINFDIEHFKLVNDYFGTHQGDSLLKYIAEALPAQFPDRICCFSRFVADVFMIFLPVDHGGDKAGDKILQIFNEYPIDMEIIPAIGYYNITEDIAVTRMCDRACMAANSVKGNFMWHTAFYDDSMRNILVEEQEILNGVETALENHEFELYMQPKCNMKTGKVTGAEALVRWRHPQKGLIQPKDFIPIFERNGFIKKLDQYVWRETARWLQAWKQKGNAVLPISVNISRMDIIGMDVVSFFKTLIKDYQLDPSWLELEITESAYSARGEEIILAINKLMNNGFTVSMDDFGSGYSSLNMLKDISVDVLKLDMRFLDKDDRKSKDILESVVHMAKWLNLKVIAEGVENRQQVDFLLGIGCTYAQGFYYYQPMHLKAFEELIMQDDIADYNDMNMRDLEQSTVIRFKDLFHEDTMSEILMDNILGAVVLYAYEKDTFYAISANEKYRMFMRDDVEKFHNLFDIIMSEDAAILQEAIMNARQNGYYGEKVIFRRMIKDKVIWLQLRLFFLSETKGKDIFYGSLEELSEEMEVLDQLRTSQEVFRIAMESSKDTIFELDIATHMATYSIQSRDSFGLQECVANAPDGFIEQGTVCEDYVDTFRAIYTAIYRGDDQASAIIKANMKNGDRVWNRITLKAIKDAKGKTIKAVGLVENITKEIDLEEKLKELRE